MKHLRSCAISGAFIVVPTAIAVLLYFTGTWIPNQPSEAAYPVRGIDVSHHQGEINWESVAAGRIRFAYIKATEGADFDDPGFKRNWAHSRAAGITRGAYHFYTVGTPGQLQAAHFIAMVPADPAALPPAIDLELSGANSRIESVEKFQQELTVFQDAITAHYGRQPVIYASAGFQKQYLKGMPGGQFWISELLATPKSSVGENWTFWQFSEKGRVPGVNGFVDLDVFNGDAKNFETFPGLPQRE